MKRLIGRGGAALLLVWTSVAGARDYFLAPDGNDQGPGSRENPWRSIARANAVLGPGDRAVFLPGVYAGSISPARSGEPGNPVTYLAEKPGSVRIEGTMNPLYNEKVLIGIQDRRYLVIDGFSNAGTGAKWLRLDRVHDSVFRNLRFDGTDFHNPIECRDSHRNRFHNIFTGRVLAAQDGLILNDLWNNFQCSYNVYEKLYITRAGHRPFGIWYDSGHNVIRDCVFDGQWSRGFELFAPQRVLMERCLIVNAFRGTASAMSMAKIFMVDSIFRRNVVLRNGGAPLEARAYQYNDGVTVLPPFGLRGSRIYHNTFFRNLEHALVFGNGLSPKLPDLTLDNEFKNNIFAENSPGGDGTALRILERLPAGNHIGCNLIWGGPGQPHTVRFYNPAGAVTEALSTAEAEKRYPELFFRNLDVDPLFVDRDRDDLRLRPDSPALDAGEPLTVTVSGGKGRMLPVRDARYFFDGFGIEGESGDLIRIGENPQLFRVVRADLERNVLELDRELAFSAGEAVTLPYTGKAPDLGAYEAEMETAPRVPVGLCLRPEEGEVLLHCDFEPESRETWFYRFCNTYMPYTVLRVDNETASASGGQSLCIAAAPDTPETGGAYLCAFLEVPFWSPATHPLVSFSYRVPRGVPAGVTLVFFDDTRLGRLEISLGGSPAYRVQDGVENLDLVRLRDDDCWHTATVDLRELTRRLPGVRMIKQWRFITGGNGRRGDQYWVDDFQIRRATADAGTDGD